MTPNPLFYQFLLVVLVLICVVIHTWWPDLPHATSPPPLKPRRKRSKRSKPFTGYIDKPLCEACEASTGPRLPAPGSPPLIMTFTRGRKRSIDTSGHF